MFTRHKTFCKKKVNNYLQQVLNSYFSRICAYKDTFTFSVLCLQPDSHTVAQVVLFFILPVAPLMPAKQLIGMRTGRRNNTFISENHFCAGLGFRMKSFFVKMWQHELGLSGCRCCSPIKRRQGDLYKKRALESLSTLRSPLSAGDGRDASLLCFRS